MPSSPHKLAPALAERFYDPVQLPASYIAQFQRGPSAERFAIGDRYDLLLDYGKIATVTLTTLVGSEMDVKWATILSLVHWPRFARTTCPT